MGSILEGVVEPFEYDPGRGLDQPVREPRVLREQRAVQVGADHVALPDALEPRAAVVAVALEHLSKWGGLAEAGAAAVVLEACEDPRALAEVDLDGDVADQARAVLSDRLEVDEADARQPAPVELVGVAEQLVAAADAEDHLILARAGVQG